MSGLSKFLLSKGSSEQLTISGLTYPNEAGYQTFADVRLSGIGNYQWYPQAVKVQDKSFIAFTGLDSNNNTLYIVVYDHFRNKVSDPVLLGSAAGGDIHHIQSIIDTDDNKLFAAIVDRSASPPKIYKSVLSGAGFDIVNSGAQDIRTPLMDDVEYSQFKKMSNGDIYAVTRKGLVSPEHYDAELWISTDNTVTFSKVNAFINLQDFASFIYRPYPLIVPSDDDIIRCAFNLIDPSTGARYLIYMESQDNGLSWRNVNNTYTHTISDDGAITHAECIANYLVVDLGNDAYWCRANGSAYINGTPYIVGGGNSTSALSLFYWDGSIWQNKAITCSGHVINPSRTGNSNDFNNSTVLYENGLSIDLICNETVLGKSQMSLFRTSDQGTTWTFVKQYTSNDNHHMNAQSDGFVLACVEQQTTSAKLFIDPV